MLVPKMRNYNLATLQADNDVLGTLNGYGSREDPEGVLGNLALAVLVLTAMAMVAGFGTASLFGLLYRPVHSVSPFILLGIGVDDTFVITNTFNHERAGVRARSGTRGVIHIQLKESNKHNPLTCTYSITHAFTRIVRIKGLTTR